MSRYLSIWGHAMYNNKNKTEVCGRDIHIECSKQLNLYFFVSGQIGLFWAVLKLI